jgi:ABC-2 type transport system permease protein
MTAFLIHFGFEFKSGLRNSNQLFLNYLFPLGFFLLIAFIMPQINPVFQETMVPALVIFAVLASNILGLPSPIVESREAGIYRSFKINGVPAFSILSIPVVTTIFHSLITSAIITVLGISIFDGIAPVSWPAFILLTILTAFTCGTLGALIGVISNNTRATVLWSQLIFLPSMLIGGLMMPLSLLPKAVQPFAALLPSTQAMQAMLGLAYQVETVFNPWVSTAVLVASTLLAFGLAIYLFNWDNRNNARRGNPLMALLVLIPYILSMFLVF